MKKWWIVLVIVCIGFILTHSMIPERQSANESLWFTKQVINPVLSWFGVKADKDVIRKIAHTVEFFILAFVLSFWWKKPIKVFYAGFTLAFLDESLQVITGRGAMITDMWIDLMGVWIGVLIGGLVMNKEKRGNKEKVS